MKSRINGIIAFLLLFQVFSAQASSPALSSNALLTQGDIESIFLKTAEELSSIQLQNIQILEIKLLARSSTQYYYNVKARANQIVQCIKAPCNPIEVSIDSMIDAKTGEVLSFATDSFNLQTLNAWEMLSSGQQPTEIKSWNSLKFDFSGEKGIKSIIILDRQGMVISSSSTNAESLLIQVSEGEYTALIAVEGKPLSKIEMKVMETTTLPLAVSPTVQVITSSNSAPTLVSLINQKEAFFLDKEDYNLLSKSVASINRIKAVQEKIKQNIPNAIAIETLSALQLPNQNAYKVTAVVENRLFGIIPWGTEKKELLVDEQGSIIG